MFDAPRFSDWLAIHLPESLAAVLEWSTLSQLVSAFLSVACVLAFPSHGTGFGLRQRVCERRMQFLRADYFGAHHLNSSMRPRTDRP